ncbi:MAG: hypothetical protein ACJAZJ_001434 [Candidatus Endobugula sp.]|jgi:hypothetical protein
MVIDKWNKKTGNDYNGSSMEHLTNRTANNRTTLKQLTDKYAYEQRKQIQRGYIRWKA